MQISVELNRMQELATLVAELDQNVADNAHVDLYRPIIEKLHDQIAVTVGIQQALIYGSAQIDKH